MAGSRVNLSSCPRVRAEILEGLGKNHLKCARLVSKSWCHCASQFLFNKVYISPRKEDIEVFKSITQHTTLNHCVRQLEYDATLFLPDRQKVDYVRDLFATSRRFSIFSNTCFDPMWHLHQINLAEPDPQIDEFVKICNDTQINGSDAYDLCKDYQFISEGYRSW